MYGGIGVSAPSPHRESTDSLILKISPGEDMEWGNRWVQYFTAEYTMYMYILALELGCILGCVIIPRCTHAVRVTIICCWPHSCVCLSVTTLAKASLDYTPR